MFYQIQGGVGNCGNGLVTHIVTQVVRSYPEQDVCWCVRAGAMECSPRYVFYSISSNPVVDPVWEIFLEERGMGEASKPFPL